jgi:hypothetical protein
MNHLEPLETLKYFNEKAETLKKYKRLMESVPERKIEFKKSPETLGKVEVTVEGPDDESIAACVLTIRFFLQNNEPISFCNMEAVYDKLATSQENKNNFKQIRDKLNNYLDSDSPFVMSANNANPEWILASDMNERFTELLNVSLDSGNKLTNREILDRFVYGEFAHGNKDKKEKLKQLLSSFGSDPVARYTFTGILIKIMIHIFDVEKINQDVINEMKG